MGRSTSMPRMRTISLSLILLGQMSKRSSHAARRSEESRSMNRPEGSTGEIKMRDDMSLDIKIVAEIDGTIQYD